MATRFNTLAYYSRVRLATARSGAGPFTYTIAAGTSVRAFGYGINQDMAAAGRSGTVATAADTNIDTAGRTKPGQRLFVTHLGLQFVQGSNPRLAAGVWAEASVRLQVGGGESAILYGPPPLLPGGGGLHGGAEDSLGAQPLPGGRPNYLAMSNGLPGTANMFHLPEGFEWMPEGSSDSVVTVLITLERAVAFTTQLADEAAAAGIRGYAHPAAADVFVDILVVARGNQMGPRGQLI